ncbi:type I-E CRISPR-associated protein Cse1/CasA [Georgenia sp. TF02-10]|nr:type I-E CRISPR-associated protein Cse1/CasA [Georgenia sp. TF02-10]UNX54045.1 type I-E CRISPR-associated protein Cse1/CasA [Georgenia sp. TF02-10]
MARPVRPPASAPSLLPGAGLRSATGEVSGLEKLIADIPNGAPLFTTRSGAGLARIGWAEAARWLVHVHAFDPSGIRTGAVGDERAKGGKGYPIGPGWAGQIGGVLVAGATLEETLLLNLVATGAPGLDLDGGPGDLPAWERPPLGPGIEAGRGEEPRPTGPVDLYTWQSRRVRLVGDDDGVTGLVLAQGDRMTPQNRQRAEPLSAWRFSEPQTKRAGAPTYMPLLHDPSRSFWRGLAALLPVASERVGGRGVDRFLAPAVVHWVSLLEGEGLLPRHGVVRLRAQSLVYGSNNSVVDEIVDDILVLPEFLLQPGSEAQQLLARDEVERTEAVAQALANLASNLAAAAGADVVDGPRTRARESFYARVDQPFRRWLVSLEPAEPIPSASARWQRTVRDLVENLGTELLDGAGSAAWRGRESRGHHVDVGVSDRWFRRALAAALPATLPQHNDERSESRA